MIKSEKGISLVKLTITVVIVLIIAVLGAIILMGENGLFNQWKDKANENETNYVIKTNEE